MQPGLDSHEKDMNSEQMSFDDLPRVVAQLRDEVCGMKVAMLGLQKGQTQQERDDTHRTMNVEEAAEYLRMPVNTLYMKLQNGEVPASKPGKRWVLYRHELDKWLECHRRNPIPLTDGEMNASIRDSHRRKAKVPEWMGAGVQGGREEGGNGTESKSERP